MFVVALLAVRDMIASNPYRAFVEAPSVMLPLIIELVRPFIEVSAWTFWIAFTEMVLSLRLVHEGTLIARPLKRLVSVIDAATPNMLALVFVLAPLAALTSLMHSQLFGLFDDGFSDPLIALSRITNMLTAPPPQENTEGDEIEAQAVGAELLFYWSTFVIRLCFGSFIVAILVGAFNKVIADEKANTDDVQRDQSLPPGFVDASDTGSYFSQIVGFGHYFFSSKLFGCHAPALAERIEQQIVLTEAMDETGTAIEQQLMIGPTQLSELVGPAAARTLLLSRGAHRSGHDQTYQA